VLLVATALAPVLIVAGPLALLVDRRGWRRWPATVAGGALTAAIAAAGGAAAYGRVLARLAAGAAPAGADLALAVALGLALGIATGPAVQALVRAGDPHEHHRRARERSARRRAATQAERVIRGRRWSAPPGWTVLGARLGNHGPGSDRPAGRVIGVPNAAWQRQALVVGETGSGKTMTALTVVSEAMRAGWDVYWIDGKADPAVAGRFLDLAHRWGVPARDGSRDAIDGWRGSPESIVNRLLATQRFTEPYYAGIARNVLRWAVAAEPPASFAELVQRMDKRELRRRWRDDPGEADTIRRLPAPELLGARYRYEGVAWAVGGALDGDWSYEDVAAAYVPVGRPEHRDQSAEIGAFLLEDLLHWAMARKPRDRDALVVIDEFSKLAARPDAAVDLVERVRSFRVGVVLIGQTWASLGGTETVRERLAGTVGTIIVHRLKAPERLVALAGTEWAIERTEHLVGLAPTGRASQRLGRRYVVSPDEVRALGCGEAFLVTADGAVRLRVRAPQLAAGTGQRGDAYRSER
jgi:hypothetical protein